MALAQPKNAQEAARIILAALARITPKPPPFADIESLLTAPDGFGLTQATPLQRAMCRVIDGKPLGDLATHPHVLAAFGDAELNGRPVEVWLIAGIRTAKSLIAAAAAYQATQTVDVSKLGAGEVARVGVVSIDEDKAEAVYNHLVGNVRASEKLRPTLVDERRSDRWALFRHPSGKFVEVVVLAGKKAGGNLVSRWMAGVVFDEAARMAGRSEGTVNLHDMLTAVRGRLLPGAQILCPTSPWAPYGPAHEAHHEYHLKPSNGVVVFQADARWLNPDWWTPVRVEALKQRDHDAYTADVEGKFLDQVQSLFTEAICTPCTPGRGDMEPEPGLVYFAGMDPATRNNAWTLVVATQGRDNIKRIVVAREWKGSQGAPLSPKAVFKEMAEIVKPFGVRHIATDGWSIDSLREHADDTGLSLQDLGWTTKRNTDMYLKVKDGLVEREIELHNDRQLRDDLKRVKRVTNHNGIRIELPITDDGRHCDYAPAVVRALARYFLDPREVPPDFGTPERSQWEADKRKQQLIKKHKMGSQRRER